MSMSVGATARRPMCDINTTPLIDVMLVLLVTLIITLPIMTHAVKLDMPQNQNQPPPPVAARGHRPRGRLRRHGRMERYGGDHGSSWMAISPPSRRRTRSRRSTCARTAWPSMTTSPWCWRPRSATA